MQVATKSLKFVGDNNTQPKGNIFTPHDQTKGIQRDIAICHVMYLSFTSCQGYSTS